MTDIRVPSRDFRKLMTTPCETCIMSEMGKNSHPLSTSHSKHPMDMIHLDLSGKIRIPSLNGSLYFQAIQDDHSKFSGVTIHKTKDTVPSITMTEQNTERRETLTEMPWPYVARSRWYQKPLLKLFPDIAANTT
eukprot:gene28006-biopygen31953